MADAGVQSALAVHFRGNNLTAFTGVLERPRRPIVPRTADVMVISLCLNPPSFFPRLQPWYPLNVILHEVLLSIFSLSLC